MPPRVDASQCGGEGEQITSIAIDQMAFSRGGEMYGIPEHGFGMRGCARRALDLYTSQPESVELRRIAQAAKARAQADEDREGGLETFVPLVTPYALLSHPYFRPVDGEELDVVMSHFSELLA